MKNDEKGRVHFDLEGFPRPDYFTASTGQSICWHTWNDFTKNVSNIRMPHGSLISTLDTHSAGAFLLFAHNCLGSGRKVPHSAYGYLRIMLGSFRDNELIT